MITTQKPRAGAELTVGMVVSGGMVATHTVATRRPITLTVAVEHCDDRIVRIGGGQIRGPLQPHERASPEENGTLLPLDDGPPRIRPPTFRIW